MNIDDRYLCIKTGELVTILDVYPTQNAVVFVTDRFLYTSLPIDAFNRQYMFMTPASGTSVAQSQQPVIGANHTLPGLPANYQSYNYTAPIGGTYTVNTSLFDHAAIYKRTGSTFHVPTTLPTPKKCDCGTHKTMGDVSLDFHSDWCTLNKG